MLTLLCACDQNHEFLKPDTDEPVDSGDTAPDTDTETDTDTTRTEDLDRDGFTVEDGDCDDASVYVSPARDEDDEDGLDNDCDGRTDEQWTGFTVARIDGDGAGSLIVLDTIGREEEISIGSCAPYFVDNHPDGGWVINNGITELALVDESGSCTTLADFSKTDSGAVYGVAVGLDGTIWAVQPDTLVTVGLDGTVTTVATWSSDEDLYGLGLAVDPATGQVGIFDYYGGFATYDAGAGFVIHIPMNSGIGTFSGAHKDGGGWYVPAWDAGGESAIYRFDEETVSWTLDELWTDEDWTPYMLALDGEPDGGDFYVTANASGVFPTVWRIVDGTGYAADFYVISTDYAGYFWGIATNYSYGG